MSTQVQYRRGTGTQNDAFTGALAEITVNTTDWTLRIHDGFTAGGAQQLVGNSATQTLTNKTLGAFTVNGNITGNLLPSANTTFNLGSNTQAWNSLYVAGNTIYLGALQLKDAGSNTFAIYTADGTTQANIDVGSIDVSSITQGTSSIGIAAPNGNAYITVGGNANVLLVTSTGISTPGTFSSTGNANVGNLGTSGNLTAGNLSTGGKIFATGNVTGDNFFINGNASAAGNITSIGNVITGNLQTDGLITATGNIIAGNLITGGLISVTGSINTLGNISTNTNIFANGVISAVGTATAGNLVTGGTISASGNANVGNLGVTGVFATTLSASGTISATGTATAGNLVTGGTLSASGNANVGNLGTTGVFATTVSATGTATAGNLVTGGTISASGNANVGNLGVTGVFTTTVSATGTATVGNISTVGTISASGNITTGANLYVDSGHVSTANGLYSTSAYNGTYTDGIVIDYDSGNGRITTGANDGLIIRNEGIASPEIIFTIDQNGNTNTPGTFSASGNIYSNTAVYVGNGAESTGLTNPIIIAKSTGLYYIQMAAQNSANTGSADLVAYADNGDDTEAWMDLGFTGSGFNDTAYTITQANDGYIFAQGGNTGGSLGGNLVIATGDLGTTHDIVFATGGFLSSNERMRFIDATGQFYIEPTTNATSTTTGALRVAGGAGLGGNIYVGGIISSTGTITSGANISGANLTTGGQVSATGTITGGNLATGGTLSSSGTATVGNVSTGGTVSASGNINGGNIITSNLVQGATVSATGTMTAGNITTAGTITSTGNIQSNGTIKANTFSSVSGALTIDPASGNINMFTSSSGNIVLQTNYINGVASPAQDADAATKKYVDDAVSTGITYHTSVFAATTTTLASATSGTISYTQPNGAGNGVGALLTTTGAFDLIDTANVQTVGTRILVKNEANAVYNGVYTWANATNIIRSTDTNTYGSAPNTFSLNDYFFVDSGTVNAGSAYVVNAPVGTITFGTSNISFAQFSSSQVYSANSGVALTGTTFSANVDNTTTAIVSGNIVVKTGAVLTTPNIGSATGTSLSTAGNVTAGNLLTGGLISAGGNITGSYIFGNGSQLTGIDATSIQFGTSNVKVNSSGGNATVSIGGTSNVVVWATTGEYITGVVSATGTATVGNVSTGGTVSAGGNVTAGNLITGGTISTSGSSIAGSYSTTGNVSGGNVLSSALIQGVTLSASGNVNGANLTTAGQVSASSTVTGGNLATGGTLSVGGTTTGNIINAITISASGNITGGNILGGANVNATTHTGTTVSVTGNITGGNVLFGSGIVSGTGNINTGNLSVTGTSIAASYSTTGNITGGNVLFGSGIVSGTGNISAGNAAITSNISSTTAAQNTNTTQLATTAFVLGQASSTTPTTIGTNTIGTGTTFARADHTHTGVASLANGGGITASATTGAVTLGSTATNANTASAIVARDASGNFSAGTITATLSGAATSATTAGTVTTAAQGNITSVGTLSSLSVTGTITSSNIVTGLGTGNDFGTGAFQALGNGATNTIFPTVGFHQPAAYASSIQLRAAADFRFYAQGAASYANVTANIFTGTATNARYADLAEKYRSDADYEPGTVVEFGGSEEITVSTQDSSRRIAGVVSTNPAHLMNSMLESDFTVDLALAGRVPVKVQGAIRKGDMLVSAGNGRARAEEDPKLGSVIGKALENFTGSEGTIEVLILML